MGGDAQHRGRSNQLHLIGNWAEPSPEDEWVLSEHFGQSRTAQAKAGGESKRSASGSIKVWGRKWPKVKQEEGQDCIMEAFTRASPRTGPMSKRGITFGL